MSTSVILPSNLEKVNRQIKALEAIIPKDTSKDAVIHRNALIKLQKHRKKLLLCN